MSGPEVAPDGFRASQFHGPGLLVVVEGPDCSGRTTQIELVRRWLEAEGHAVTMVGLKRSELLSEAISHAKYHRGHILGPYTQALLYATDFADQVERRLLPALEAGFIALADRYTYTQVWRSVIRGIPYEYTSRLFRFVPQPDLLLYLAAGPETLLSRALNKYGQLDFWESGLDIPLAHDPVESFLLYQARVAAEFAKMRAQQPFVAIDAERPQLDVFADVQDVIRRWLARVDPARPRSEAAAADPPPPQEPHPAGGGRP